MIVQNRFRNLIRFYFFTRQRCNMLVGINFYLTFVGRGNCRMNKTHGWQSKLLKKLLFLMLRWAVMHHTNNNLFIASEKQEQAWQNKRSTLDKIFGKN